jgi:hypothetical protein
MAVNVTDQAAPVLSVHGVRYQTHSRRRRVSNCGIRTGELEAPPGFEPGMEVLQ